MWLLTPRGFYYRVVANSADHKTTRDPESARIDTVMPDASTDAMAAALPEIARCLEEHVIPAVGGLAGVREKHFSDATKAVLGAALGSSVLSRKLSLPAWPSLGTSGTDIVVGDPSALVAELKWCQLGNDKVYEAIWDLFKMALTTRLRSAPSAYLVTGAPCAMWKTAFCRDLFAGGDFDVVGLCNRVMPWSRTRRTGWDDLLGGGYDRFPHAVPAEIRTESVGSAIVRDRAQRSELRAVRVLAHGVIDVPFVEGWPHGQRPRSARRPPRREG